MFKLVYSTKEYRKFRDKALKIRSVLLSEPKINEIRDYCKANGYITNINRYNHFIYIKDKTGRFMYIQEERSKLVLIDKIRVDNGTGDPVYKTFKENLTDLLNAYYIFMRNYGSDLSKREFTPPHPSIVDEELPEIIEVDEFENIKPLQKFFRIQRFDLIAI